MKKYVLMSGGLIGAVFILLALIPSSITRLASHQVASIFFIDSVKTEDLQERYEQGKKIKILVVPGHDQSSYGTLHEDVREVDLNLELGEYLFKELEKNDQFEVTLAQTTGGYDKDILDYINDNSNLISTFQVTKKAIMNRLIAEGLVTPKSVVDHISASNDVATKLYGLNYWANANNIDLVLHLHFNDYPGRRNDPEPKYEGFSIYLPEAQYSNSKASWDIGKYIKNKLSAEYKESNHPLEKETLIPDQELIAIGSFNTLDAASVLIEYGYIYEPHLGQASHSKRSRTLKDLAWLTAEGVEEFFED